MEKDLILMDIFLNMFDEHSNNGRLYSRPGQTLMIFNDVYGREATYNIPLDIVD